MEEQIMANKRIWKLLVIAAVLCTVSAGGLAAQQIGRGYTVAAVEHLGDFESDNPRDRAINDTVAKLHRQNPGFTFERVTGQMNSLEVHLTTWAYEQTITNANIDSTYAVLISSEAGRYIIFISEAIRFNTPQLAAAVNSNEVRFLLMN
jgi:hypothetical protein